MAIVGACFAFYFYLGIGLCFVLFVVCLQLGKGACVFVIPSLTFVFIAIAIAAVIAAVIPASGSGEEPRGCGNSGVDVLHLLRQDRNLNAEHHDRRTNRIWTGRRNTHRGLYTVTRKIAVQVGIRGRRRRDGFLYFIKLFYLRMSFCVCCVCCLFFSIGPCDSRVPTFFCCCLLFNNSCLSLLSFRCMANSCCCLFVCLFFGHTAVLYQVS